MEWHIGCSGFHYKHWKEVFYPEGMPQRKWFDHYCQHFDTLELNNTFYNFPRITSLEKWYADSPPGFLFAVKAYRGITHFKKLIETQALVSEMYQVISDGLKEKLGTVLFQMPPNFTYSEERLERVLKSLDPVFNNVIEMRHNSWWQDDVYVALAKQNISFCGMSHPTLPNDVIANTPVLYYRMHGNQQLYASAYSPKELQDFAEKVKATQAERAYIYFNNDIGASAIFNAKELLEISK
ncbi:DUF72 domain-containing protein [Mucilaginibacter sp. PAMB04274]|uniref:DUF72 domain-containing protein n=1 Tax=Mucilaginibacter sp. PAMB04274 TaxID=3138568 RepID=UPI0031F711B0